MLRDMRIVPLSEPKPGQTITFVLAMGTVRHVCRLQTTFRTQSQAFSYFHKHRNAFEDLARTRLALGETDNGVIELSML